MMTLLKTAFFVALALMVACDQAREEQPKQPADYRDSILVGMTYDEVERLLGKPMQIDRGVNELQSLESTLASSTNDRISELDYRIKILRSGERTYPQELKSIGNLLYVTWWYDQFKVDTVRYIQPRWVDRTVATTPIVEYFINNRRVTKEDFELTGDTVYWGPLKMSVYPRDEWQEAKDLKLSVGPPEPALKELRTTPRTEKRSVIIPDTNYQAVVSNYAVIFDAASGRVTSKGFVPYQIFHIK